MYFLLAGVVRYLPESRAFAHPGLYRREDALTRAVVKIPTAVSSEGGGEHPDAQHRSFAFKDGAAEDAAAT